VHVLATSRQVLIVPAALLDAEPPDQVDLGITPDLAAGPGPDDWVPLAWMADPAGTVLGPGILAGPGGHLTPPARRVRAVDPGAGRRGAGVGTAPRRPVNRSPRPARYP